MTRALLAVGALLALAFLVFGLVVFLTRSEDRVAVDNLLAGLAGEPMPHSVTHRAP